MDTDSFLISYQAQGLGANLDEALGEVFSGTGAVVFRRWQGPASAYLAVSGLGGREDVDHLTDRVDPGLRGAGRLAVGRLVFDETVPVAGPLPQIEDVLRPDPTTDLWLPSIGVFAGSEILVCPRCGDMNRHFYPPPH